MGPAGCNISTPESRAGSGVQSHPHLHSKFKVSLAYMILLFLSLFSRHQAFNLTGVWLYKEKLAAYKTKSFLALCLVEEECASFTVLPVTLGYLGMAVPDTRDHFQLRIPGPHDVQDSLSSCSVLFSGICGDKDESSHIKMSGGGAGDG